MNYELFHLYTMSQIIIATRWWHIFFETQCRFLYSRSMA